MRYVLVSSLFLCWCMTAYCLMPATEVEPSILGNWKTEMTDENGKSLERILTFTEDDVLHVETKTASGKMINQTNYSYKLLNENLVLHQGDQSLTITVKWIDKNHFQFAFDKQVWNYARIE